MVTQEHPNVSIVKQLDPGNFAGAADLFAEDVVWHYFNPRLSDLEGDYVGPAGLQAFFGKLGTLTGGTFEVEPISVTPFGDELVVTHTKNRMILDGRPIEIEVVAVWRVVGGRIVEVWDIPSVYTAHASTNS